MSSHELPPTVVPRRFRLQVADGAYVEVSYTEDSSTLSLEILTANGNTTVAVTAHLFVAVAEAILELANEVGPIAEPEWTPPPEPAPEPEKPPIVLPEGLTPFIPDEPAATVEVPNPEGTP